MSVKIRLARTGKAHRISYRIVAQDTKSKRDGKFLEVLGFYDPFGNPNLEINKEKMSSWEQKGAKPTQAVLSLIEKGQLTKRASKRKLKQKEQQEAQAEAQAPAQTTEEKPEDQKQEPKEEETKPEEESKPQEQPEKAAEPAQS